MKLLLPLLVCSVFGLSDASAQATSPQDYVVVVGVGSPYQTIDELVQVARSSENGLLCGAGRGTPGCEGFARSTRGKVNTVGYKGTAPVVNDLASKNLVFGVLTIDDAKTWIAKGKVRALAVSVVAPSSPIPGTPTMAEAGFH